MKNKNVKGILALVVVTAFSFGIIWGSKALTKDDGGTAPSADAAALEELNVSGFEGIEKAVKTEAGYEVQVKSKGYGGDILLKVSFDADAQTIAGVQVLEQNETPDVGARIAEEEFLGQFAGAAAPVYLPGMSLGEEPAQETVTENMMLQDGSYVAKTAEADKNGFVGEVNMTVEDGKITSVNWDYVTAEGKRKSVMSESGEYTMTEDGPTWKEQAEALASALVENQSLSFFTVDEQGKTDAVSGVSISIGDFLSLAEDCMKQAAGLDTEAAETAASQNGTQVDAVSGASISSKAAVEGINSAYDFLQTVK